MSHQIRDGVEVSPQVFLARNELVYRFVAISAGRNGDLHLGSGESLLKPPILMTTTWNQMVFRRTLLENPQAECALTSLQ